MALWRLLFVSLLFELGFLLIEVAACALRLVLHDWSLELSVEGVAVLALFVFFWPVAVIVFVACILFCCEPLLLECGLRLLS